MLRVLIALLIACLSLPALAAPACHAPPVTEASAAQHGHHAPETDPDRDERAMPAHVCIGCVPPAPRLGVIGAPLAPVAMPVRAMPSDMADGRAVLPAVPPPRSFA